MKPATTSRRRVEITLKHVHSAEAATAATARLKPFAEFGD